ncbi:MAG: Gfo/Idh/MocA family oxidoreductase [Planctomycetes bacterium]|nr:Gfo/Idh/MocA family oxidoreductase [Planctomycetota bacterium]
MKARTAALGVAVVGLGVGEEHARAYARTGACELRWLFDLDPEKSRRLAGEIRSKGVARGFEEILGDPATHVVSIASYDNAHAEQVIAALRAGKHVFVEKPLCRSPGELAAIREAWREAGSPHLASNLVLRGAPLYRWLKETADAGELGRIYAFDGDYLYGRIEKITEGWRKDVEDYSVIQGGGVHLVDLMLWICGERPRSVTAAGNRIATEGTRFRYRDFVAATYAFASGLVGRITANFGCVHRHQHVVRVFGTRATFLFDDRGARLHTRREPEAESASIGHAPLPASKGILIPDFVRGILDGRDPRAAAEREFRVVEACLAADRALAAGTPVEVEGP